MKKTNYCIVLLGMLLSLCQSSVFADKKSATYKLSIIAETAYSTAAEYNFLNEEDKAKFLSDFKEEVCKEVQKLTWQDLVDSQEALLFVKDAIKEKYFHSDEYPETEFETIATGSALNYAFSDGFKIQELDDAKMWEVVWNELYKGYSPKPNVPFVDFNTHSVILVIDNIHGGGGNSVRVQSIKSGTYAGGKAAEVRVEVNNTTKYRMRTAAMDRPFHLVKFKKK